MYYFFYSCFFISDNTCFSTSFRYSFLFCWVTNGTDQNCVVVVLNHPNTNEYTPITSRNFTEFKYNSFTGNAGAP